ncbi:hypothetical protein AK812_SmicGene44372 [Symbiodinium microadriaticum]|uniref:Uncharacterized protein n=1 Tax=Symbiodinium microadriaticum TaxID=2951 RepID=A0A1Q9BYP7_SYMMI|nr:hypothetical protein AK812_SmicGene44372 [Symbiodinium microadriaticum]
MLAISLFSSRTYVSNCLDMRGPCEVHTHPTEPSRQRGPTARVVGQRKRQYGKGSMETASVRWAATASIPPHAAWAPGRLTAGTLAAYARARASERSSRIYQAHRRAALSSGICLSALALGGICEHHTNAGMGSVPGSPVTPDGADERSASSMPQSKAAAHGRGGGRLATGGASPQRLLVAINIGGAGEGKTKETGTGSGGREGEQGGPNGK